MEKQLIPRLPNDVSKVILAAMPRTMFPCLRLVSKAWKGFFSSQELGEIRQEIKVSEGWIYVMAECPAGAPFKAYNPQMNKWFELPPTPGRTEEDFWEGFACVTVGTNLLLIGGVQGKIDIATKKQMPGITCRQVVKYDALKNKWSTVSSMNSARSWFAAAAIGDFVYVAGGQGSSSFLNSAEVYDFKQDTWRSIASMHRVRSSCNGVAVGGKFWVIAGEFMINSYEDKPRNGSAEIFDPQSGSWALSLDMWLDAHKVPGPITVMDERLLSVHGTRLMSYDSERNSWTQLGQIYRSDSCQHHPFSRFGFECVSHDGEMFIIGGTRESWINRNRYVAQHLNTVEVCSIRKCIAKREMIFTWRNVAPLGSSMGTILAAVVIRL